MSNEKPKGINFRVLIHQLTPGFKKRVSWGQIKLSDVFILSNAGETMLKNLIEDDLAGYSNEIIKDSKSFCDDYNSDRCDCTDKCSYEKKPKKYFGLI